LLYFGGRLYFPPNFSLFIEFITGLPRFLMEIK